MYFSRRNHSKLGVHESSFFKHFLVGTHAQPGAHSKFRVGQNSTWDMRTRRLPLSNHNRLASGSEFGTTIRCSWDQVDSHLDVLWGVVALVVACTESWYCNSTSIWCGRSSWWPQTWGPRFQPMLTFFVSSSMRVFCAWFFVEMCLIFIRWINKKCHRCVPTSFLCHSHVSMCDLMLTCPLLRETRFCWVDAWCTLPIYSVHIVLQPPFFFVTPFSVSFCLRSQRFPPAALASASGCTPLHGLGVIGFYLFLPTVARRSVFEWQDFVRRLSAPVVESEILVIVRNVFHCKTGLFDVRIVKCHGRCHPNHCMFIGTSWWRARHT